MKLQDMIVIIQVYGVYTIRGSLLMYLGIAIFSPSIAIAQWLGAILGCLAGLTLAESLYILTDEYFPPALVVGPSAYSGIYIGGWSYSALLTGHFFPLENINKNIIFFITTTIL